MGLGGAYPSVRKTMAHTAHTVHPDHVRPVERHTFGQTGLFATACRALSIVSGGFLLGANQGWGALVGLGLGVGAFLATEASIRRVRR